MSQPDFKTAQELDIAPIEREYLERFVRDVRKGALPENHVFDMGSFLRKRGCGTAGCIAGTMERYARDHGRGEELPGCRRGNSYVGPDFFSKHPLEELFLPQDEEGRPMSQDELEKITVQQAANAAENFLRTGNPNWREVLGHR